MPMPMPEKVEMDRRMWRRMPPDLLEHVLSFVPLKDFLGLRSTCKYFNSLIFSPSFISRHAAATPTPTSTFSSFLLLSHSHFIQKCPLFNTAKNSWCDFSLSFPPILSSEQQSCNLVASSNGLLCFSNPKSSCFTICNVLSRSVRQVKFPMCPFDFGMLTLVSTEKGYTLFVLSNLSSSRCKTLLYSSVEKSWRQFDGFNQVFNYNCHQKGVLWDGQLFFITTEPFSMLGFHLESGLWQRSPIRLPGNLTFARLVGDGEQRMYLVGGVGVNGISRSMKLWGISEGGGDWEEIETLPEAVRQKFVSVCYHNYDHVYCFWHQGLICVCCYTWPEILYYRVDRRTWHWLRKCPALPEKWSCGFRWFPFKPEIYAAV